MWIILLFILLIIFFVLLPTKKSYPYDIYVISMPKSKDRRKYILNTLRYRFKFFDAFDGKTLSNDIKDKLSQKDKNGKYKASDGQIGCLLSHFTLWKQLQNNDKPVLILEDDVIIKDDINKFKPPKDFDILYFGSCYEMPTKKVIDNIYKSENPICMHGYLISKQGREKMIKFFENNKIDKDFDNYYVDNLFKKGKLNCYTVMPNVILQNGLGSTIR